MNQKDRQKLEKLKEVQEKINEDASLFCHGCHTCHVESFHSERLTMLQNKLFIQSLGNTEIT